MIGWILGLGSWTEFRDKALMYGLDSGESGDDGPGIFRIGMMVFHPLILVSSTETCANPHI